jgi:hypothetical protein
MAQVDTSDKCHIFENERIGYAQSIEVAVNNIGKGAYAGKRSCH